MNESIEQAIKDWPKDPQEAAKRLIDEYGEPDEHSESQLIWYDTKDGWKRTVLSREEVPHGFPAEHMDYLEQFINYQVPLHMYSKLAEYDGSVIIERTKGEMSARCGGTSMNFVAINLAHDISGRRSVEEARKEYGRLYQAYKAGEKPAYTEAFQFDLPTEDTRDPDVETLSRSAAS
ncbi:MAG TPA: hypothetical protein VGO56_09495 [Pyrinomonadaceae bacterium]|jgi:hypothetical protein|nr:hypothetical protein [Pyrinomonadaceae bacterium]